jgi:hypothetical protein
VLGRQYSSLSWARVRPALGTSLVLACALSCALACSSVSAVRLQPEAVEVGPGLRPVAGIQANAFSLYVAFVPIPGGVELDHVVNRMLVATAKAMGADKVTQLQFQVTPGDGIWALRRLLGWRSARASGIAVQLEAPAPDPRADLGPEGPGSVPAGADTPRTASREQP